MKSFRSWIHAARPRTLPLAASCTLVGSALAWREGKGSVSIFVLALLTTLLLQILSNFANDYGDFTKGVDNHDRVGPERAMQGGLITQKQMTRALVVSVVLTLISGVSLLWVALGSEGLFLHALIFLTVGIAAITAAFKYTVGRNPYGYRGFGDFFVFLFFGIVGVCGTYFLYTVEWNSHVILPAMTVGLLSTAVLNLNNLRDHINDAASGKRTLVVSSGFRAGKIYQLFIVVLAFASAFLWMFLHNKTALQWIPLIALILPLLMLIKLFRTENPAALDPELKKTALSAFFFSLLFFLFHCTCW